MPAVVALRAWVWHRCVCAQAISNPLGVLIFYKGRVWLGHQVIEENSDMLYVARQRRPVGLPRGLIAWRWLVNGLAVLDGLAGQAGLAGLLEHIGQRWVPCAGAVCCQGWLGELAGQPGWAGRQALS